VQPRRFGRKGVLATQHAGYWCEILATTGQAEVEDDLALAWAMSAMRNGGVVWCAMAVWYGAQWRCGNVVWCAMAVWRCGIQT